VARAHLSLNDRLLELRQGLKALLFFIGIAGIHHQPTVVNEHTFFGINAELQAASGATHRCAPTCYQGFIELIFGATATANYFHRRQIAFSKSLKP